jgi:hypothetical protein
VGCQPRQLLLLPVPLTMTAPGIAASAAASDDNNGGSL